MIRDIAPMGCPHHHRKLAPVHRCLCPRRRTQRPHQDPITAVTTSLLPPSAPSASLCGSETFINTRRVTETRKKSRPTASYEWQTHYASLHKAQSRAELGSECHVVAHLSRAHMGTIVRLAPDKLHTLRDRLGKPLILHSVYRSFEFMVLY